MRRLPHPPVDWTGEAGRHRAQQATARLLEQQGIRYQSPSQLVHAVPRALFDAAGLGPMLDQVYGGRVAAALHALFPQVRIGFGVPTDRVNLSKLIELYRLADPHPALTLFAESVRNGERAGWAKNGCENEGLWAIGYGIATLAGDDAGFVERMMPVYDALYAYCTHRLAGGHGWTSDR